MLLDSLAIRALTLELDRLTTGLRVEKIHQPLPDTLSFRLYPAPAGRHLLICLERTHGHVTLSDRSFANPATPPAFCGLLRKYLTGARLRGVRQHGLERILELAFTAGREGVPSAYVLTVELFGNIPNAYLLDESGRILGGCQHYQTIARLQGAQYVPPPPPEKPSLLEIPEPEFTALADEACRRRSAKVLMAGLDGAGRAFSEFLLQRVIEGGAKAAWTALAVVRASVELGVPALAGVAPGAGGRPTGLVPWMPAAPLPPGASLAGAPSEAVEAMFGSGAQQNRAARLRGDLSDAVEREAGRVGQRLERAREDLERVAEAERYERWGHLLQASPAAAGPYASSVRLPDLFDPAAPEIEIPLKPGTTLTGNARIHFNRARRLRRLEPVARRVLRECEESLQQLDLLRRDIERVSSLEPAEALPRFAELREHLTASGLTGAAGRGGRKARGRDRPAMRQFRSSDGFRILVGRSDKDNDRLVTRLARRGDLWLHAHDSPGAHVVVKLGGAECPRATLEEAAKLAAHFSPHRYSSKAPVAFTRVENVKKPSGAPAGLVTLRSYSTLVVTCEPSLHARLTTRAAGGPEADPVAAPEPA